jgi:hypothetical protein
MGEKNPYPGSENRNLVSATRASMLLPLYTGAVRLIRK